jgi:hypothetical protein
VRILVCGGRDYGDAKTLCRVLGAIFDPQRDVLIHGRCKTGADQMAHEWARECDLTVDPYPVDHELDGPWPAAGPRRNARMFRLSEPDLVVAFPGSRGTENMCEIAMNGGVPVLKVWGRAR